MARLPFVGIEDERSQQIGGKAAMNAFSGVLVLVAIVISFHVAQNGVSDLAAVQTEIAALVVGCTLYFGTGLYYTRKM
jgi:uncharacterized membrane protein